MKMNQKVINQGFSQLLFKLLFLCLFYITAALATIINSSNQVKKSLFASHLDKISTIHPVSDMLEATIQNKPAQSLTYDLTWLFNQDTPSKIIYKSTVGSVKSMNDIDSYRLDINYEDLHLPISDFYAPLNETHYGALFGGRKFLTVGGGLVQLIDLLPQAYNGSELVCHWAIQGNNSMNYVVCSEKGLK